MLEGLVNIQDGPVASYPDFSQPDGQCILGGHEFLVEIKCPFGGYIPKQPPDEYLVQCQAHMAAHPYWDKTLLIYYTPTCLVMFIIYADPRLWGMISVASKSVMEYVSKKNLHVMGYSPQPLQIPTPDIDVISSALRRLSRYTVIFEFEEGGDLRYEKNFFQELTIPDIQHRITLKNL